MLYTSLEYQLLVARRFPVSYTVARLSLRTNDASYLNLPVEDRLGRCTRKVPTWASEECSWLDKLFSPVLSIRPVYVHHRYSCAQHQTLNSGGLRGYLPPTESKRSMSHQYEMQQGRMTASRLLLDKSRHPVPVYRCPAERDGHQGWQLRRMAAYPEGLFIGCLVWVTRGATTLRAGIPARSSRPWRRRLEVGLEIGLHGLDSIAVMCLEQFGGLGF
jgi:hypothetical protein